MTNALAAYSSIQLHTKGSKVTAEMLYTQAYHHAYLQHNSGQHTHVP